MAGKNYKFLWLAIGLVLCLISQRTWGIDSADRIITAIHERYKSPGGLVLTYRREVKTKTMSMLGSRVKGDLASGKIYVLPPDLLKVEQKMPRRETLVTDGKSLWWIIPEEKRVYQYSSEQFGQELHIITDLWESPSRLKKRFNITVLKEQKEGRSVIEMIPSPQWEQVDRIRIQVSKDYAPKVLEMINPIGTTTTFYFDAIEPAQLTKESFRFVVPEGFTVVHE